LIFYNLGPGGFGTVDPSAEGDDGSNQGRGYTSSGQPHQDYLQKAYNPGVPPTTGNRTPASGGNNNAFFNITKQSPPGATYGYGAPQYTANYPSTPQQVHQGYMGTATGSRPQTTNLSWGERSAQPPLTSSKRDQNWEKKRRLWMAKKNGAAGGNPWPAIEENPYNPPSPLSKFVSQQSQLPSRGNLNETDRVGTSIPPSHQASYPVQAPPRTAYREEPSQFYQQQQQYPNVAIGRNTPSSYGNPPATSYGVPSQNLYSGSNNGSVFNGALLNGDWNAGRGITTGVSVAPSTTRASSRQPPGGHTQWSPFGGQ
jgi:hypothetical protein